MVESLNIHKGTFKAFLKKLQLKPEDKIKIFQLREFNGMIDMEDYVNKERELLVEHLLDKIASKGTRITYYLKSNTIEVWNLGVYAFNITDERFEPLKQKVKLKSVLEKI